MNTKMVALVILSLLFTAIGLVCGWYAASKSQAGTSAGHAQEADTAETPQAGSPAISPQALKNMGVNTMEAELSTFVRYQPVTAVVSALPDLTQGVYAPIAGRITTVEASYGSVVESGDVLVSLIRDPIPRVDLILTGDVLKPVSENLHESMANLRRATVSVEILEKELKRLKGFNTGDDEAIPLLPAMEIIKIEYELMQAERELSIVQNELIRHGLSDEQIRGVETGKIPPVDAAIWLGALSNNGYWTPLAQRIHASLPEKVQKQAWTIATIAELVAGDLVDESLLAWMQGESCADQAFLEIGGLLQRGHNLEDIKDLCVIGALEPLVKVRAPAEAPDWDVRDLLAKPGKLVEKGEPLLILENPRRLYLRAEPTEGEVQTVVQAIQSGAEMEALPLVAGSAPPLDGLSIQKVFSDEHGHTFAMVLLENTPVSRRGDPEGKVYRSWRLREGQRYELRVPLEVMERVYTLPSGAVVEDGADKIVFLRNGDDFQKIRVEVLYQDHEVAVLPSSTDIFPGNPIVTGGAFALSLALQSEGGGSSGGHDHVH